MWGGGGYNMSPQGNSIAKATQKATFSDITRKRAFKHYILFIQFVNFYYHFFQASDMRDNGEMMACMAKT